MPVFAPAVKRSSAGVQGETENHEARKRALDEAVAANNRSIALLVGTRLASRGVRALLSSAPCRPSRSSSKRASASSKASGGFWVPLSSTRPWRRCAPGSRPCAMPPPRRAEPGQVLRQVSILFLDVAGSTALSQRLDPEEEVSAVMDVAAVANRADGRPRPVAVEGLGAA